MASLGLPNEQPRKEYTRNWQRLLVRVSSPHSSPLCCSARRLPLPPTHKPWNAREGFQKQPKRGRPLQATTLVTRRHLPVGEWFSPSKKIIRKPLRLIGKRWR